MKISEALKYLEKFEDARGDNENMHRIETEALRMFVDGIVTGKLNSLGDIIEVGSILHTITNDNYDRWYAQW